MKIFIVVALALFIGCSGRIDHAQIVDQGKVQIGPNLYLKKLIVIGGAASDKVYVLVNDQDELVAGTSATYQVGKFPQSTSVR